MQINHFSTGEKIRLLRKKAKLTQLVLAIKIGVNDSYISKLEQNKRVASLGTIRKLASALGCSVSYLVD